MTSTVKEFSPKVVAVRQTPLTETLSPIFRSSMMTEADMFSTIISPPVETLLKVPTSSTNPVNMISLLGDLCE
jgi:hypothetical protein